ncbi:MAG: hypothetical protein H6737_31535 [Alphaproteobacteria bacterium]|nr:hypothetical protein [Alphaproteobacteria bacterium]
MAERATESDRGVVEKVAADKGISFDDAVKRITKALVKVTKDEGWKTRASFDGACFVLEDDDGPLDAEEWLEIAVDTI